MATSRTDFNHPFYQLMKEKDLDIKKIYKLLSQENPKYLKHLSLGESFDFISGGGLNYVFYPTNNKGLVRFVKLWMNNQEPRINLEKIKTGENSYLVIEKSRRYNYIWNKFSNNFDVELPRIDYKFCPRDKSHKGTVNDLAGRVRCFHQEKKALKPSFVEEIRSVDKFAFIESINYSENVPYDPTPDVWEDDEGNYLDYSEERREYLKNFERYNQEEREEFKELCYSIIKEPKDIYLSLQTVFDRLNCSYHSRYTLHPFSGFDLANYVKSWFKQKGKRKFYRGKNEHDFYRVFPDFTPYSSDD